MTCDQGFFTRSTYAWILIREQSFSQTNNYAELRDELAGKFDLDLSVWVQNDVDNGLNCDYDEIKFL